MGNLGPITGLPWLTETLPRPSSMATRPTTCSLTHHPLDSSQTSGLETQQPLPTLLSRLLPASSHNSQLNQPRLSLALWSGPSSTPPRTPSTTPGIRATPDPLTPLPTWCQQHLLNSMQLTTGKYPFFKPINANEQKLPY